MQSFRLIPLAPQTWDPCLCPLETSGCLPLSELACLRCSLDRTLACGGMDFVGGFLLGKRPEEHWPSVTNSSEGSQSEVRLEFKLPDLIKLIHKTAQLYLLAKLIGNTC